MGGFSSTIKFLRGGIKVYSDIKTLYTEGKNAKEIYQKLTTISVESRKELIENFLASKIDYNDHVKIQGTLLDYAHLYKPKSYINSIEVEGEVESNTTKWKLVLSMAWKPFQLPVGRIPSVQIEDGILSLAFLYPLDFDGFIYEGINAFVGGPISEPTFKVPDSGKPIPVLLRQEDIIKYRFKRVEITAQIIPLPNTLVTRLIENPFSSMAFSEVVNPINDKMPSLGLKVDTNKGQIKDIKGENRITQCNASLFMETHIEGHSINKLIGKIPELCSKAFTGKSNAFSVTREDISDPNPTIFQISNGSGIRIIGRFPNVIGFYYEGNLVNIEEDYLKFINEFNAFTRKLHDMVPNLILNVDFMHDYQLKSYLDIPLLNSKSSGCIKEPDLMDTMKWLRSE